MNPSLSENIAQQQRLQSSREPVIAPSKAELVQVRDLVERIGQFKLKRMRNGDFARTWFSNINQDELLHKLQPSPDQLGYLAATTLKLSVSMSPFEGPRARSLVLWSYDDPQASNLYAHTLLNILAQFPEDNDDQLHRLYIPSLPGMVIPETSAFIDIESIVDSFLP